VKYLKVLWVILTGRLDVRVREQQTEGPEKPASPRPPACVSGDLYPIVHH
jgi:hypothetical protein